MPNVKFTENLKRHVECPHTEVDATTVCKALELVFDDNPKLKGYVLDEQGKLRHHVVVFLNGQPIADRESLLDAVDQNDEIYVFQALSGG